MGEPQVIAPFDLMLEHALASLIRPAEREALASLKPWDWATAPPLLRDAFETLAKLDLVELHEGSEGQQVRLTQAGYLVIHQIQFWRDEHVDEFARQTRENLDLAALAVAARALAVLHIWRENMRHPRSEMESSMVGEESIRYALTGSWRYIEQAWVAHLAFASARR